MDYFILSLIWIIIWIFFAFSSSNVAFAESPELESNLELDHSEVNSHQNNNNSKEGDNSSQDSDADRRSSISMSDDLWSGDPKELKTATIESFLESINDCISDLDDEKEIERWEGRKSELEDELDRRNRNRN